MVKTRKLETTAMVRIALKISDSLAMEMKTVTVIPV